jgi:hypothetical protein
MTHIKYTIHPQKATPFVGVWCILYASLALLVAFLFVMLHPLKNFQQDYLLLIYTFKTIKWLLFQVNQQARGVDVAVDTSQKTCGEGQI